MDDLTAHGFWNFACSRRLRPTPWGDYLRLVRAGEVAPPAISNWTELWNAVGMLQGFNVDKVEVRAAWSAYLEKLRKDASPRV